MNETHFKQSDDITELLKAMSNAQAEIKTLEKNIKGYNYKYAGLPAVINEVRPILHTHGLSFNQFPVSQGNDIGLINVVGHNSGQWMRMPVFAPVEKLGKMTMIQSRGSHWTYLARYSYNYIFGVASDEDTDGADVHAQQPKKQQPPPAPKKRQQPPPVPKKQQPPPAPKKRQQPPPVPLPEGNHGGVGALHQEVQRLIVGSGLGLPKINAWCKRECNVYTPAMLEQQGLIKLKNHLTSYIDKLNAEQNDTNRQWG